jgi:hypothetical protein
MSHIKRSLTPAAQVGRLQLPSGGCVWVFATELTAKDDRAEADIENLRNLTREHFIGRLGVQGLREYEKPVGASWGFSNDNARPTRSLGMTATLTSGHHHSGLGSQRNRLIATKPPATPQIARISSWWPANPRSSANGFSSAWLNGRTGKTPARSLRNRELIWK